MMNHRPLARPASQTRPTPAPVQAAPQGRPLQAVAPTASPCACGGGCPRCGGGNGGSGRVIQRQTADPSPPPNLKLDQDEELVLGGEPGFDDGSAVQAAPADASAPRTGSPVNADRVAASLGSGGALAPHAQAAMNQFFGQDLGHVRVHTDGGAHTLATSLNAHAFTVGHQIAFAAGHYQPDSPEGQSLIAHELTHVLQQRQGLDADIQRAGIGAQGDRYEVEAEGNAQRFLQGQHAQTVSGTTGSGGASTRGGGALQLYSASTAVAYAKKWATSTNPAYPRDGNDCTNFISQAVFAGGWTMAGGSCDDRKDDGAWWYGDSQCWYPRVHRSYTWGGAQNFFNFTNSSGRGKAAARISDLDLGDVLQVAHDGHVGHTTMVTGKTDDSNLLLSYHTSDTLDLPVWGKGGFLSKYASSSTPTEFYAWKM